MSYKKWWIDEDLLRGIHSFLASQRNTVSENLMRLSVDDSGGTDELQGLKQFLASKLEELEDLTDRFNWAIDNEPRATESEEMASIDALIERVTKETGWGYAGNDRSGTLKRYYESLQQDRSDAYGLFATLADDIRVKLLAMQFMIQSVLSSATHREKDTKLDMLSESVAAIVMELQKIDKDRPQTYQWYKQASGSWDYARALRDLHHQKSRIQSLEERASNLEAENEGLRQELVREA